jgi:predicted dinucleotide-binding enzyme
MKIGIIGSGVVGQALAKGCLKYGYEVMIATNNPSKIAELKSQVGPKASVGSFEEAAKFGDIVILSIKATAAESTAKSLGSLLKGKIVIDTMNPISEVPPKNGVLNFFTDINESLMERLQKKAPDARFVKAFSCIGSALMVNPQIGGSKPSMFICGNDPAAKKEISKIIEQFGFDVEDLGAAEAARAIEPLCILWCIPGMVRNDWVHALKMLR